MIDVSALKSFHLLGKPKKCLIDKKKSVFLTRLIHINRILVLQAENEQEMNDWVQSIRAASQLALNSGDNPKYIQQSPNLRKVKSRIKATFVV